MTLPDFKGQFMPTMIPAAPGTCVIEQTNVGPIRTPVVAWAPDADNPYRAPHPISVDGLERLSGDRAIEFASGMIHDRRSNAPFADLDEWLVFVERGPKDDARRENEAAPPKKAPSSGTPDRSLTIEWATQPFKNNSFYRYNDGTLDFIFQVEGGVEPPKQKGAVQKIKRDDFMSLKKTMDVADVEDLKQGKAPGLDELGDFSDDGSDDDDLIGGTNDDSEGGSDYEDEEGLI